MKEYMTWIEDPETIKGPQELNLTIKELEPGPRKYLGHNVIATVSPTEIPGADISAGAACQRTASAAALVHQGDQGTR